MVSEATLKVRFRQSKIYFCRFIFGGYICSVDDRLDKAIAVKRAFTVSAIAFVHTCIGTIQNFLIVTANDRSHVIHCAIRHLHFISVEDFMERMSFMKVGVNEFKESSGDISFDLKVKRRVKPNDVLPWFSALFLLGLDKFHITIKTAAL